jgi:hypothetical protein
LSAQNFCIEDLKIFNYKLNIYMPAKKKSYKKSTKARIGTKRKRKISRPSALSKPTKTISRNPR